MKISHLEIGSKATTKHNFETLLKCFFSLAKAVKNKIANY